MTGLTVSVVVVSRGRPKLIQLCLKAISQLRYDNFELIVVADRAGLAALKASDLVDTAKAVHFEEPNIATARNLGIAQAAGEIVAFVDMTRYRSPGGCIIWPRRLRTKILQPQAGMCVAAMAFHFSIQERWWMRLVHLHRFGI